MNRPEKHLHHTTSNIPSQPRSPQPKFKIYFIHIIDSKSTSTLPPTAAFIEISSTNQSKQANPPPRSQLHSQIFSQANDPKPAPTMPCTTAQNINANPSLLFPTTHKEQTNLDKLTPTSEPHATSLQAPLYPSDSQHPCTSSTHPHRHKSVYQNRPRDCINHSNCPSLHPPSPHPHSTLHITPANTSRIHSARSHKEK